MRYTRNRIYLLPSEQEGLRHYRIFLAGCGIGSVIAECALRLGFESITLADGDTVEESNLNRQNYLADDVNFSKVESLKQRLLAINPAADIHTVDEYLTKDNIEPLLEGHHVAINALDFNTDAPFVFDRLCQQKGIPALHPYNIGWAALLFLVTPEGPGLDSIAGEGEGFEKAVVRHFLMNKSGDFKRPWIGEVLTAYEAETPKISPPQLSVASWILGGLCTDVLFRLATGRPVRQLPDHYFLTAE